MYVSAGTRRALFAAAVWTLAGASILLTHLLQRAAGPHAPTRPAPRPSARPHVDARSASPAPAARAYVPEQVSSIPPARHPPRHLFHTFQGQLGNQLFQYAAVLGIARRNAMVPCLHGDPLGPFFDGVESHACVRRDSTPVFSENGGYATYHDFRFEHDAVLDGYLQSFRYFPSNARAALRIKPALQRQAAATLAGLPAGVRVALHVRRRHDALEYLRLPGAAYYRQAMALFRARHAAAVFVVVSDDVAWCRAQPHFRHADVHVQRPGQAPAADLALLAACDHVILSRGTFGWWGAYLGADARNGSVVYYDREFDMSSPINKGHVEPRDFYPPRWMALGGG